MPRSIKKDIINSLQQRKILDLQSVEKSKAFCMKPWVHLFVSHYGVVVPCCLTPQHIKEQALGDINKQTVQEIWNGKPMREFRINMLKDRKDSRCHQCYESEENGLFSSRKQTNLSFIHKLGWAFDTAWDGSSEDSKPIHWDLRISNLCNFKCRICGHHSSSQWYEDAKALNLIAHDTKITRGPKDFDRLMQQLDFVIPELEEIYFAGGEPLIMEEHYQILQTLIERKRTDVRLGYNTNFSQVHFKGHDLFELWSQFETVRVNASLDGSGKRGELQRSGQIWEKAVANRQRMLEVCPNVKFLITPTINVFSVFHLPDFQREWTEMGLIRIDEFMPQTLRSPEEYSIRILPSHLKKQVEEKYTAHVDWILNYARLHPPVFEVPTPERLEQIKPVLHWITSELITGHGGLDAAIREFRGTIIFMNSLDDTNRIPEFREITARLDELRGEDTRAVFPELADLWEN